MSIHDVILTSISDVRWMSIYDIKQIYVNGRYLIKILDNTQGCPVYSRAFFSSGKNRPGKNYFFPPKAEKNGKKSIFYIISTTNPSKSLFQ
jgi:hypothetical protein